MLRECRSLGATASWDEAHPGARASRPHKSRHSFAHLLHPARPAAATGLCFGLAHAVQAGRKDGCRMAGKPSGRQRKRMRAGRPRSRVGEAVPLGGTWWSFVPLVDYSFGWSWKVRRVFRAWGWSRPGPGPAFDATVRPESWLWVPGAPPGSCRTGIRNPSGALPASCRATSG